MSSLCSLGVERGSLQRGRANAVRGKVWKRADGTGQVPSTEYRCTMATRPRLATPRLAYSTGLAARAPHAEILQKACSWSVDAGFVPLCTCLPRSARADLTLMLGTRLFLARHLGHVASNSAVCVDGGCWASSRCCTMSLYSASPLAVFGVGQVGLVSTASSEPCGSTITMQALNQDTSTQDAAPIATTRSGIDKSRARAQQRHVYTPHLTCSVT